MGRALTVLPFDLNEIQVATPCSMEWADMVGGDKVRFCGACQKNVFNLSGMARQEALDLVRASEGRMCVRFFRRADGTILTEDCPVGLRRALKNAKRVTLMAAATSLAAIGALVAFLGMGAFGKKSCQVIEDVRGQVQLQVEDPPKMGKMGEMVAPPQSDIPPPREIMGGMPPPPSKPREIKGRIARPVEWKGDMVMPSGG